MAPNPISGRLDMTDQIVSNYTDLKRTTHELLTKYPYKISKAKNRGQKINVQKLASIFILSSALCFQARGKIETTSQSAGDRMRKLEGENAELKARLATLETLVRRLAQEKQK